ncbi:NVEALA domain-containing protein [uncultured Mediterranea sp.]|uniref:NVEALA domain-containing protein n=1 Tax=uncultured Mediterranea sp. TaxID=1926662 RepID=UPI0027D9B159|nr:NVEALA domain-containing protein [uncultured Mediterranea sp.]
MNKVIKKVAFFATIVTVAGYGVYVNQTKGNEMSDVMLENVEALAWEESDTPYRIIPCAHAPWNECRTSSNNQYEKCGFLSYC